MPSKHGKSLPISSARIAPRPAPLPRVLFEGEVSAHRSTSCKHYGDCLDEAIRRDWPSWSCTDCPMHTYEGAVPEIAGGDDDLTLTETLVLDCLDRRGPLVSLEIAQEISRSTRSVRRSVGRLISMGLVRLASRSRYEVAA